MDTRKLKLIGKDRHSRDVYSDESGIIFKNIEFKKMNMFSVYGNSFESEPYLPITGYFEIVEAFDNESLFDSMAQITKPTATVQWFELYIC